MIRPGIYRDKNGKLIEVLHVCADGVVVRHADGRVEAVSA